MAREGGATTASRCAYGYRLCCAQAPGAGDLAILVALHERERERYGGDPAAAKELIAGDPPPTSPATSPG